MNKSSIQIPYRDVLVEMQDERRLGLSTKRMQDWMLAVTAGLPSYLPLVITDFGAGGNGLNDDTLGLQKAIDQTIANGGGTVIMPPGTYSINTVTVKAGTVPVTLLGCGPATVLKRRSTLADNVGLLDISGANVTLDSFAIDGDVTVPVGLLYNVDFTGIGANDPMALSLTKNTSIWLHAGADNFLAQRVLIRHTGGYAALVDAGQGPISNAGFVNCRLENNRPNLFGVTAGQANFGSWTGGIYVNGDGRAANPGCVLKQFLVTQCEFVRNTGNGVWSHLYGLDELHEDFGVFDNYFLDQGLDCIEVGGVIGGAVLGNRGRRVGYVTVNDTDQSVPRWLQNLNATAIDSSGLVKGVLFSDNSFISVNGGCLDMDGHCDSVVGHNMFRIPYPGEPEYTEDQIAVSGPMNNGSYSYGVNISNSSNTAYGATNLNISGNSLINLRAGAVRLFSARQCFVSGNNIIASDEAVYPPIGMGPIGPGPNQRCYGNRITMNNFVYNPAGPAPTVFEDDSIAPFVGGEQNTVCGNVPIMPVGTSAVEFQKSPFSSSVVYAETVWFP